MPFALRFLLASRPEVVGQTLGLVYRAIGGARRRADSGGKGLSGGRPVRHKADSTNTKLGGEGCSKVLSASAHGFAFFCDVLAYSLSSLPMLNVPKGMLRAAKLCAQ